MNKIKKIIDALQYTYIEISPIMLLIFSGKYDKTNTPYFITIRYNQETNKYILSDNSYVQHSFIKDYNPDFVAKMSQWNSAYGYENSARIVIEYEYEQINNNSIINLFSHIESTLNFFSQECKEQMKNKIMIPLINNVSSYSNFWGFTGHYAMRWEQKSDQHIVLSLMKYSNEEMPFTCPEMIIDSIEYDNGQYCNGIMYEKELSLDEYIQRHPRFKRFNEAIERYFKNQINIISIAREFYQFTICTKEMPTLYAK